LVLIIILLLVVWWLWLLLLCICLPHGLPCFAVVAVVDFLDDVGIVVLCVCYLSIEVWFTFSGACLRVGWFAKLFILVCAVVVFVAGGAVSFLVVYQKTSADDQVLFCTLFYF
jgi:hypothetical protein